MLTHENPSARKNSAYQWNYIARPILPEDELERQLVMAELENDGSETNHLFTASTFEHIKKLLEEAEIAQIKGNEAT